MIYAENSTSCIGAPDGGMVADLPAGTSRIDCLNAAGISDDAGETCMIPVCRFCLMIDKLRNVRDFVVNVRQPAYKQRSVAGVLQAPFQSERLCKALLSSRLQVSPAGTPYAYDI